MIVINELYALNRFIVIVFNERLGANLADVVEHRIANAANVLHQILPKALNEAFNVLLLAKSTHVLEP